MGVFPNCSFLLLPEPEGDPSWLLTIRPWYATGGSNLRQCEDPRLQPPGWCHSPARPRSAFSSSSNYHGSVLPVCGSSTFCSTGGDLSCDSVFSHPVFGVTVCPETSVLRITKSLTFGLRRIFLIRMEVTTSNLFTFHNWNPQFYIFLLKIYVVR